MALNSLISSTNACCLIEWLCAVFTKFAGVGNLTNGIPRSMPDFFIRTGVPSLYLSDFFLFVCLFVVVVVVFQLFFSPLGFCASQVLLIFFRLSHRN